MKNKTHLLPLASLLLAGGILCTGCGGDAPASSVPVAVSTASSVEEVDAMDGYDYIYQIVDLLVDTCSTKRKMLRIAGDDKPTEVVRSRLKKLNADHIRFVLGCLAENNSPVRNMKQYLLAALFNAPTTMNLYYQNKTNHDFARGSPKAG